MSASSLIRLHVQQRGGRFKQHGESKSFSLNIQENPNLHTCTVSKRTTDKNDRIHFEVVVERIRKNIRKNTKKSTTPTLQKKMSNPLVPKVGKRKFIS